jgi:hypothetical protein
MAKLILTFFLRESVWLRAHNCCEYCKSQDKFAPHMFTIDHVIPQDLGGDSDSSNLAYACFLCNRLKSNKLKHFDKLSSSWIDLFNPRKHIWNEHFSWNEDTTLIIGMTPIGRISVEALKLNREKLIEYRKCLIPFGVHPPLN